MTVGAVLCGGASRRMGIDKALLEIDGRPMAELVARALAAAGCDPVVFVGGDAGALGRVTVADRWPGEGPLGGVITALEHAAGGDVVVAACDLPALDAATVHALFDARRPDTDVVVAAVAGRRSLVGWWSPTALANLQQAWDSGVRSMEGAFGARGLTVTTVEVSASSTRNVNEPRDVPSDRI